MNKQIDRKTDKTQKLNACNRQEKENMNGERSNSEAFCQHRESKVCQKERSQRVLKEANVEAL